VLKAAPDEDLYVVWSSSVDNATFVGTRAELLAGGCAPSRLARADRYGTSSRMRTGDSDASRYLGWDSLDLVVHNQPEVPSPWGNTLLRSDLGAFARARRAGDDAAAGRLLVAIKDEFEDSDSGA
jgi:hypothetical protein